MALTISSESVQDKLFLYNNRLFDCSSDATFSLDYVKVREEVTFVSSTNRTVHFVLPMNPFSGDGIREAGSS